MAAILAGEGCVHPVKSLAPTVNSEWTINLIPVVHVFGLWVDAAAPDEHPRIIN